MREIAGILQKKFVAFDPRFFERYCLQESILEKSGLLRGLCFT